jgi:hypothetical protein
VGARWVGTINPKTTRSIERGLQGACTTQWWWWGGGRKRERKQERREEEQKEKRVSASHIKKSNTGRTTRHHHKQRTFVGVQRHFSGRIFGGKYHVTAQTEGQPKRQMRDPWLIGVFRFIRRHHMHGQGRGRDTGGAVKRNG